MNKNNMMPLIGMLMIVIVMLLMVMLCKSRKERMSNKRVNNQFTRVDPMNRYYPNKTNLADYMGQSRNECAKKCKDNADCNYFQYYKEGSDQHKGCKLAKVHSTGEVGESGHPPMRAYTMNSRPIR
jgi:FtsZ-interacting cell division protein ZipA